jgi:hypothetical protein
MQQQQQQQVNLSQQQVQQAAAAGAELLEDPTLRVPMPLALGQLGTLKTLLLAIATGKLILAVPPEEKPQLKMVEGDASA